MDEDTFYIYGPKIEESARTLGLYVDHSQVTLLPDGNQGIVVDMVIGDVAFSPRVIDPEREKIDRAFQEITTAAANNEFLDERERLAKRLAAGLDPLGEE